MAKSYQDLISEARVLLQDTDTDLRRYSDATLLSILNRGLQDLSRIRPDFTYSLYSDNSLSVPEIVESGATAGQLDWTSPFSFEMWFYNNLVNYVVGVAEITDDEYTENSRAALLLQLFRNNAMSV